MIRKRYVVNYELLKEEITKAGGITHFLKKIGFRKSSTFEFKEGENGEYMVTRHIARAMYKYNPALIVKTRVYFYFRGKHDITEHDGFIE